MEALKLSVMTAGRHFLYLPLYYAHDAKINYFGLLPDGYDLALDTRASRTDEETLAGLLEGQVVDGRQVAFAVCDPTVLLSSRILDISEAVILGALVTNTAFWVVDRRTARFHTLADLRVFDRILTFDPGTTAHRIATHIRRESGKTISIHPVAMGTEILALRESEAGTMALSPDILEIDDLEVNHPEFKVAFDVASTPEYSNVLVTALISRADVVSGHRELTGCLVEALQRALVLVHYEDEDVIEVAAGHFGKPKERVRSALKRANESHVFPATLEVSRAHWTNAVRISCEAQDTIFDEYRRQEAARLYERHISLEARDVRKILARAVLDPIRNAPPQRRFRWEPALGVMGLCLILSGLVYGGGLSGLLQFLAGMLGVGASLAPLFAAGSKLLKLHVAIWTLITLFGGLWMVGGLSGVTASGATGILLGGELSAVVAALAQKK